MSLVDIALIVELFENFLNDLFVVGIGSSDEFVIGCVEQVADILDLAGNTVNVLFGCDALGGGNLLDLLTVLVCARLEENIVALQSFVSRYCVRHNYLVAVADVRLTGSVGDRRCDVKFSFTHKFISSFVYLLSAEKNAPKHLL